MSKNVLSEKGSRRNLECLGLLPEVSRAGTYVQRQERTFATLTLSGSVGTSGLAAGLNYSILKFR